MKHRKFHSIRAVALLAAALAIVGGVTFGRVRANADGAQQQPIVKEFFNEYAGSADGKNNFAVNLVDSGVEMATGVVGGWGNYATACSYLTVPIDAAHPFSITFTVPEYSRSDDPTQSYHSLFTDIILRSPFDNNVSAQLRIYNDSVTTAYPDSLGTRMSLYDHFWAKDETSAGAHEGSGKPYSELIVSSTAENARRIHFTADSNGNRTFTVKFDTENFFQTYFMSDGQTLKPYVDENSTARERQVQANMAEAFADTDCVKAIIRMGGMEYRANGALQQPSGRVKVTIHEYCGQDLANENGYLNDTSAPFAATPKVAANRTIANYSQTDYLVRSSASDPVTASTVFYSDFATDVIGYKNLTYKITVTDGDGHATTTDGLRVTVGAPGAYTVALTVTDPAGNSYTTPATPFTVIAKFHIVLDGDMPTSGTLGTPISLPALSAQDASGSAVDPTTGDPYQVAVKVTDPLDIDVAVTDGKFTPTRVGNYRVRISSKNADGSQTDTQTFTVQVTEQTEGSTDKVGCGCNGTVGTTAMLGGVGLLIAAGVIAKKRNK